MLTQEEISDCFDKGVERLFVLWIEVKRVDIPRRCFRRLPMMATHGRHPLVEKVFRMMGAGAIAPLAKQAMPHPLVKPLAPIDVCECVVPLRIAVSLRAGGSQVSNQLLEGTAEFSKVMESNEKADPRPHLRLWQHGQTDKGATQALMTLKQHISHRRNIQTVKDDWVPLDCAILAPFALAPKREV